MYVVFVNDNNLCIFIAGTTTPTPAVPVDKCINCNQLCHYFKTKVTGQNDCQTPKICVNDSLNVNCSADTFWRDPSTCVSKDACTCSSRNGTLVTVFHVH